MSRFESRVASVSRIDWSGSSGWVRASTSRARPPSNYSSESGLSGIVTWHSKRRCSLETRLRCVMSSRHTPGCDQRSTIPCCGNRLFSTRGPLLDAGSIRMRVNEEWFPKENPRSGRAVTAEKGESRPLGSLSDLPSHAILDRGRLVGLWEYVPAEDRSCGVPSSLRTGVERGIRTGAIEPCTLVQPGQAEKPCSENRRVAKYAAFSLICWR
jgi:hypothetical protein